MLDAHEVLILRFIVGGASLSWVVFLLALTGFARWELFIGFGAMAIVLSFYFVPRRRRAARLMIQATESGQSGLSEDKPWGSTARIRIPAAIDCRKWLSAYALLLLCFGAFYFFHAMKPEASPDGATYHLGLVARFVREGRIAAVRENVYAGFPKGMEMMYLFAFVFGRHSAAALVHFSCLVALTLGIFTFACRVGHPVAGMIAGLLFFLSPVIALNGTTAYNDVALALACFGTFWLIELWKRSTSNLLAALSGFVAGFAFAVKYTGATAVLYVLIAVAVHAHRKRSVLLPSILCTGGFAVLSAAPHLVHNWIVRDNPLAPFFNRTFPNPYVHVSFEDMAREMARFYPGLTSYWQLPWEVAIRGGITQGLLGPVFLLAPLALLSIRSELGRKLIAASMVFALPVLIDVGTRTLIPSLPFICLALGLVLARFPRFGALVILLHVITVLPPVARLYAARGLGMLDDWPIRVALRLEPEEQALDRLAPGDYDVVRVVNRHVPRTATVLAIAWVLEAYTTPNIRTHHLSAANERLTDILWTPLTPELQPLKSFSFSFSKQRLRGIRLIETIHMPPVSVVRRDSHFILNRPRIQPDHWGISEIRLRFGNKELLRKPGWSVTAFPNPWDSGLALDGNPMTAWKTWQTAAPGMFFQLEFGGSEELDHVFFDSPLAQATLAFRLMGMRQDGNWTEIASYVEEGRIPPPVGMRQSAIAALARESIDYVLVDPSVWGADDFYQKPNSWGLRFVDQAANGVRLYQITVDANPPRSRSFDSNFPNELLTSNPQRP
jgi:hypothetical protein